MFFVYIIRCSDGSFYTGWTNNLEKRIEKHNMGKASKYTRARLPVELVFSRKLDSKSEAMSAEYRIKKLSRKNKEKIIKEEKYQEFFFSLQKHGD